MKANLLPEYFSNICPGCGKFKGNCYYFCSICYSLLSYEHKALVKDDDFWFDDYQVAIADLNRVLQEYRAPEPEDIPF